MNIIFCFLVEGINKMKKLVSVICGIALIGLVSCGGNKAVLNVDIPDARSLSELLEPVDLSVQHHPATVEASQIIAIPEGKRVAFGWQVAAIPAPGQGSLTLHFEDVPLKANPPRLRITVALDDQEVKRIALIVPQSQRQIGTFDIRYAFTTQIFELVLTPEDTQTVISEGVELRMEQGSTPLYIFSGSSETVDLPGPYRPHLMLSENTDPLEQFKKRMLSLDSITLFGWMEGCVLDGIYDLQALVPREKAQEVARRHLDLFFDETNNLRYENFHNEPVDKDITTVEATLPFAVLAKLNPQHPVMNQVVAYWKSHTDGRGAIKDGDLLTTEGCYTVAYPLAVAGERLQRLDLDEQALAQLIYRKNMLVDPYSIYQRRRGTGIPEYQSWSRGAAWYSLGLCRSLIELKDDFIVDELCKEMRMTANFLVDLQRPDGLWNCFLREPDTTPDTAASAGIAAAIALGVKHGILPPELKENALRTFIALQPYLTPDGYLTGVSQVDKGGEALQREDYRVIAQFGMGLMAQLTAALGSDALP
jgi:unsaturated rhamnogalacturonyl hydrolase